MSFTELLGVLNLNTYEFRVSMYILRVSGEHVEIRGCTNERDAHTPNKS